MAFVGFMALEVLLESGDQTPSHGEEHVRDIVGLADNSKPAIDHDVIAGVGLDSLGVLNSLPRHLREGVSLDELTLLLVAECVLLTIGAVPHPVEEDVHNGKHSESVRVPGIFGGVVVGQVKSAVAVSEGHSSHVPEGEEES